MKSESFSKGYISNQRHGSAAARANSDIEMKGVATGPRKFLYHFLFIMHSTECTCSTF